MRTVVRNAIDFVGRVALAVKAWILRQMWMESGMRKAPKDEKHAVRSSAIWLLALAAVVCGFGLGCEGPPNSLRPLYTRAELQKHPQNDLIKGKWILATRDSVRYETMETPRNHEEDPDFSAEVTLLKEADTGLYRFEFTPTHPTKEFDYMRFNVALMPIGDRTFFDAVYEESLENGYKFRSVSDQLGKDVHWFGAMRIEPNFLRFTLPSQDLFKPYAQGGSEDPDASTATFFDGTFVGSTNQLRAVMAGDSNPDEVYDSSFYFCRPDADCNLAVTEDQLKAGPKDSGVLDDAGGLFWPGETTPEPRSFCGKLSRIRRFPDTSTPGWALLWRWGAILPKPGGSSTPRAALGSVRRRNVRKWSGPILSRARFLMWCNPRTAAVKEKTGIPRNRSC
jgi:hypothetical protein